MRSRKGSGLIQYFLIEFKNRTPRLAAFYVIGIFTGGFSAIFAYVLSLLHGRYGIPGWAWIFVGSLDYLSVGSVLLIGYW